MLRYNILFTLVLTTTLFVQAQVEIKGTVTDANTGQALMGVTVLVEGTYTGTITETDGQFSLNISPDSAVLVFSYVGYTTNKVKIGKRKVINVALVSEEYLDGAVVIGYGKQSKAKLTSAVSTIDPKTLKKMPVPNVSNALEGMASGLFVRQGSGEPGFSGSSFEIRNFGNALVIVDGSPGNMDDLDPNEIESISILKDAAAAAVYG